MWIFWFLKLSVNSIGVRKTFMVKGQHLLSQPKLYIKWNHRYGYRTTEMGVVLSCSCSRLSVQCDSNELINSISRLGNWTKAYVKLQKTTTFRQIYLPQNILSPFHSTYLATGRIILPWKNTHLFLTPTAFACYVAYVTFFEKSIRFLIACIEICRVSVVFPSIWISL